MALLFGAVAPCRAAVAQGVPRDTTTQRRDTTRAAGDTSRVPTDTARVVPADTARIPGDTTRAPADTTRRGAVPLPSDTLADTAKVPKDTIKAPLAHAPLPSLVGALTQYHWNRESLFASGALTLLDLLSQVPGVTTFRSGWLGSPQFAAYMGNPARVRVFYDGVEIDPLDPRDGGVLDMATVPLWSLEEISVERGADEIRVYLRSWRVSRTETNTRIDVLTGDLGTNIYHAFYGKRFGNGLALQLGGQQYGTSESPTIGGGSELALMGRLGWAKGSWSVDAFATRSSRTRDEQDVQRLVPGGVTRQERTRTDAYVRAGYGDPDSTGAWAQLMVASESFDEHTPFRATAPTFAPLDTADTTRSGTQYVATAGITRGSLRLSAAERYHVLDDGNLSSLSGRLTYDRPLVALSLYAEYRGPDTTSTEEASIRFTPLSFLALSGTAARRHGGTSSSDGIDVRGEVGVRVGQLWLTGGAMRRGAQQLPALIVYDSSFVPAQGLAATGIFGTASGKIYKAIGVNISGVRWSSPGYYRPQLQSREELYLQTNWIERFPSGDFGFLGSVAHEYRQTVLFPTTGSVESAGGSPAFAFYSHTLTARIEVRIQQAVLFWHGTFGLSPQVYEYVPGLLQPRQRQLYGVRWQFWN
ncbi:MAG TPA: Plug domain-containing protein [Gemmatimonadaceae bacterium]